MDKGIRLAQLYKDKPVKINDIYVGMISKIVSNRETYDGNGYLILNAGEGDREILIFFDQIVAIQTAEKLWMLK